MEDGWGGRGGEGDAHRGEKRDERGSVKKVFIVGR